MHDSVCSSWFAPGAVLRFRPLTANSFVFTGALPQTLPLRPAITQGLPAWSLLAADAALLLSHGASLTVVKQTPSRDGTPACPPFSLRSQIVASTVMHLPPLSYAFPTATHHSTTHPTATQHTATQKIHPSRLCRGRYFALFGRNLRSTQMKGPVRLCRQHRSGAQTIFFVIFETYFGESCVL